MFTLRCTQKLLTRMKTKPSEALPSTTVLGDWYANLVHADRQHLVLCCCENTYLPIVIEARDIDGLVPRLNIALLKVLLSLGVSGPAIDNELALMTDAVVAKTTSRVVVGVMNEYGYAMSGGRHTDLVQLSLWLAHTPLFAAKSKKTLWPDEATRAAFAAHVVH
jgi:hypothetical protein